MDRKRSRRKSGKSREKREFEQCAEVESSEKEPRKTDQAIKTKTKIKGLYSRKITSLPNLHASFQSSPEKNRILITSLFHTMKVATILIPSFHGLR